MSKAIAAIEHAYREAEAALVSDGIYPDAREQIAIAMRSIESAVGWQLLHERRAERLAEAHPVVQNNG